MFWTALGSLLLFFVIGVALGWRLWGTGKKA